MAVHRRLFDRFKYKCLHFLRRLIISLNLILFADLYAQCTPDVNKTVVEGRKGRKRPQGL